MSYPNQISNPPSTNWAVQVNESLDVMAHQGVYGRNVQTSSDLTWGYFGGRWGGFSVADGTHTLTNAADNYIVVLRSSGASSVSTATTNWDNTTSYARVFKVTTAGDVVTATEDHRAGVNGAHGYVAGAAGTVTATGGSLTSNAVVLGAGTTDTKVVAGITTDGASAVNLGVAGSSVGKVVLSNATSGSITIQPVTGALGTVTLSAPATTGTLALLSDISGGYQPLDSDLTTIAGLTATTDNFMQAKSSAWASRTVAQVSVDLQATGLVTDAVGFRTIPQNSQSAAYTTVAADSGKHIHHPSTDANARTFTIDSNANVAYPIGTCITFTNMTSQVVTIAITTDTLYLAGTGTTGSRSLAQYGVATALKMTSTTWIISGTGLT